MVPKLNYRGQITCRPKAAFDARPPQVWQCDDGAPGPNRTGTSEET